MKKISLLLFLFLVPAVFAVDINLKDNYFPGSTLQAEISGLTTLNADNILFYSGRVFTPMVYDVAKINDKFYLYAVLPTAERNYTLKIQDAEFYENGNLIIRDLYYNFSVKGNVSLFSVEPAFVLTSKDFKINVRSNFKEILVSTSFANTNSKESIGLAEPVPISFSVANLKKSGLNYLTISSESTSYTIPVVFNYISSNDSENQVSTNSFYFAKSSMTFLNKFNPKITILLINPTNLSTGKIMFNNTNFTGTIKFTPASLTLKPYEEKNISIEINAKNSTNKIKITAYNSNQSSSFLVKFETSLNQTNISNPDIINRKTCSELNGLFCESNQVCSTEEVLTLEGLYCCTGECKAKSSSSKYWIILVIILVLGGIGGFLYFRNRKSGKKTTLEERTKEFEARFKPQEVKDKVSRA